MIYFSYAGYRFFFSATFTDVMEKLSVVIITYNEEKNIGRCIDSVSNVADEIVVLDSLSTDRTKEICLAKGARFFESPFSGYIEQANKALDLALYEWVLCLDADEVLSPVLSASILEEKSNLLYPGYTMNRCTNYCGRFIRFGSWYPDRKLRLFNRHKARWTGINPHSGVEFISKEKGKWLKGDIFHYSYTSIEEHNLQNERFSSISAKAYFELGKKSNWFKMTINPAWAFVRSYFIRLGFLDGYFGFVIARKIAQLTWLKYKKLYLLQQQRSA